MISRVKGKAGRGASPRSLAKRRGTTGTKRPAAGRIRPAKRKVPRKKALVKPRAKTPSKKDRRTRIKASKPKASKKAAKKAAPRGAAKKPLPKKPSAARAPPKTPPPASKVEEEVPYWQRLGTEWLLDLMEKQGTPPPSNP